MGQQRARGSPVGFSESSILRPEQNGGEVESMISGDEMRDAKNIPSEFLIQDNLVPRELFPGFEKRPGDEVEYGIDWAETRVGMTGLKNFFEEYFQNILRTQKYFFFPTPKVENLRKM